MPTKTCDADDCEKELWTNNPDQEGYCPDCAGEHIPNNGKHYQQKQAEAHRAQEQRNQIVNGDVWRDTR